MKIVYRSLLVVVCSLLLGVAFSSRCFSQQEERGVSQKPVLRNLLLEEFTAIHCSYCPSGHAIAQNMHNVLGSRLQTIAVHVGNLAIPSSSEPDFRTECGEAWYALQGGGGMPSGAMNRTPFKGLSGGNYILGRSDWQTAARLSMNDTAKVNLYAEATLDTLSRVLTVRVEYFYPQQIQSRFNTLTLAITENYIPGTQSGSSGGSRYLHRHVLRDVITPVFGDTIWNPESGKVLEKTYTYTIPEQYVNRVPVFANMEVIAFVSDTNASVLNSTDARIEYQGRFLAPHLLLSAPLIGRYWSRTSIPVKIENLGTEPVESVSFSIEWGKNTYSPSLSSLFIPYGSEQEVEVPIGQFEISSLVKYRITAVKVNDMDVESNTVADYVTEPYVIKTDKARLELKLDEYGSDITYTLRNRSGKVLEEGGPFEDGEPQQQDAEWSLQADSVYSLEIKDAFLDGFNMGYRLLDANNQPVVSELSMGMSGSSISFVYRKEQTDIENFEKRIAQPQIRLRYNPVPSGCGANEICLLGFGKASLRIHIFDLNGRNVFSTEIGAQSAEKTVYRLDLSSFHSGFYFIKVEGRAGSAVQKMILQ